MNTNISSNSPNTDTGANVNFVRSNILPSYSDITREKGRDTLDTERLLITI